MVLSQNRILVNLCINDEIYTCLVDTGATHNVICKTLKLTKQRNVKTTMHTMNGLADCYHGNQVITDDRMKIKDPLLVDLSEIPDVHIILGIPFLLDNKITIDFGKIVVKKGGK